MRVSMGAITPGVDLPILESKTQEMPGLWENHFSGNRKRSVEGP